MGLKFSNFGKAVVSSAPDGTTGLSFTVEAGKGLLFPSLNAGDYFYAIFKDASGNREVVKVEARGMDSLTIAADGRGLDGTTARTWAAGDYFVAGLTNAALEESLSNANLIALGALATSADKLPYFTGSGAAALSGLSSFIRTFLDDADAAAARATLGAAPFDIIPAGSVTDWFQAAAPAGWTQVTTHNNKAMRIVSGTGAGTGGSVAFTAAFASQAVVGFNSATTLTEFQIPVHAHTGGMDTTVNTITGGPTGFFVHQNTQPLPYTGLTGGGGSHNHAFTGTAINLAVQYIDMILASKD
ncbi:MAG: hypothetical protein M3Q16_05885 [Pseudomonadota bacterium]|nr:hypothetical protein [Pseudomonadota bacterium]